MRVLYVEDDRSAADLARRWIARRAPHVTLDIAPTLAAGLARLHHETPPSYDVVLTDLDLPDGSGLDLLARCTVAMPLAVVVLTGRGDEATAVAALRAGADDYMVKQGDYFERLPLALERAVHRHRAEASRRGRPLTVLYAEHHGPDIDSTRRHFLRHAPHIRLDVVTTGPAVLDRLAAASAPGYDVILLDYRLPALNGLEVLEMLQRDGRLETPVIIVTGQGDQETALQAIDRGGAGYAIKTPGYLFRLPIEIENAHMRAGLLRERAALRASQEQLQRTEASLRKDIRERQTAEAALQASEARNRAILRAMPDLSVLQSPDGVYLDYQVGGESGVPAPPAWFRRWPAEEVLPRELGRAFLAAFARSGRPAEPQVHEYALRMDGQITHFEARMVGTDDGNVLTLIRDVTERVRTTEALRESHRRIADLAGRLIAAQEEERARVARELHDDLGQRIAAITVRLGLLERHLPDAGESRVAGEIQLIERDARAVADDIRQLSHDLHPAVLQHVGLAAAVRAFCVELHGRSAFEVDVQLDEPIGALPAPIELCLYRAVQECLRNAVRHAGVGRATVMMLHAGEEVELLVADSGAGFDPQQPRRGLGLVSLEERVRLCGGRVRIDARPGGGTRVTVRVPAAVRA